MTLKRGHVGCLVGVLLLMFTVDSRSDAPGDGGERELARQAIREGGRPIEGWGSGLQIDRFLYREGDTAQATIVVWNLGPVDGVRTLRHTGSPEGCHFGWWITDGFGQEVYRPSSRMCLAALSGQLLRSGTFVFESFDVPVGILQPGVYRLHGQWGDVGGPKPLWGTGSPYTGDGRPGATVDFRVEDRGERERTRQQAICESERPIGGWGSGIEIDRFLYREGDTAQATVVLWNLGPIDGGRTFPSPGFRCQFGWWITDGFGQEVYRSQGGGCLAALSGQLLRSGTFVFESFDVPVGVLQPGVYRLHGEWGDIGGPHPLSGTGAAPYTGNGRPGATVDFRVE